MGVQAESPEIILCLYCNSDVTVDDITDIWGDGIKYQCPVCGGNFKETEEGNEQTDGSSGQSLL